MNSANNGPYGDAIMQELIPYLESHFRIIREALCPGPDRRIDRRVGIARAPGVPPDFFGGTWTLYPDPIDFHHYGW